jgi:hypothetical protein
MKGEISRPHHAMYTLQSCHSSGTKTNQNDSHGSTCDEILPPRSLWLHTDEINPLYVSIMWDGFDFWVSLLCCVMNGYLSFDCRSELRDEVAHHRVDLTKRHSGHPGLPVVLCRFETALLYPRPNPRDTCIISGRLLSSHALPPAKYY